MVPRTLRGARAATRHCWVTCTLLVVRTGATAMRRRMTVRGLVVLGLIAGTLVLAAQPAGASPSGGMFYPLSPTRVLDTRVAGQGPCISGGETRFVTVGGRGGVPADARSVVLNITVVGPTANGYLTAFPAGEVRPTASSLNFTAGSIVPNSVTVKVGVAGQIAVFIDAGCANVLVDVAGFHPPGIGTQGSFQAVTPVRRLDTRLPGQTPCIGPSADRVVTVTGAGGVPADALTVMLNVTVVSPTAAGYLTVSTTGTVRPPVSTLNFAAGEIRANAATVAPGPGGQISVFVNNGCANVLIDVVGYIAAPPPPFPPTAGPGGFTAVSSPTRLLDTRSATPCVGSTARNLTVTGGVVPAGAASVTLNVTVTRPTASGYLTVFPVGTWPPVASNLNFSAAQTVANAVTVRVGIGGQISLIVNAGCADVLVDAVGYTTTPPTLPIVTTVAGHGPAVDGSGSAVRLGPGRGIARDSVGNVYVADFSNHVIRKVTPAGVVSTLAGAVADGGCVDGPGATARFSLPQGVAADAAGNVYVVDSCAAVRKITPAGVVSTFAGQLSTPGNVDGTGASARFSQFAGSITINSAGTLFVGDGFAVRRVTTAGVVSTLAGAQLTDGFANGTGSAARFSFVTGLAADSAGNVIVADNSNFVVRRITAAGVVSTLAGTAGIQGLVNATGAAARFGFLRGVALDASGNAYLADTFSGTIRRVTPAGAVTTVAGNGVLGFVDGTGSAARLSRPYGVASDASGNLSVLDQGEDYAGTGRGSTVLRRVSAAGAVTTAAGRVAPPGPAVASVSSSAAQFAEPQAVASDPSGIVWVVDPGNLVVRRIGREGTVTTVAGGVGASAHVDGTGTAARFANPLGIVCDSLGNAFVVDNGSSTIRKITPAGVVTTLAGHPTATGSANGTGTAARFTFPTAIAIDSSNNLYVSDTVNDTVRKVTPAGVVTTLAGSPGLSGSTNGTGAAARFVDPLGIAVDSSGNVFVADSGAIRQITAEGVTTTLAGLSGSFDNVNGSLSSARFSNNVPSMTVAPWGALIVADAGNKAVRSIGGSGVTQLAGQSSSGFAPADGTPVSARFAQPVGVAASPTGRVFVADQWAHAIRSIGFLPDTSAPIIP